MTNLSANEVQTLIGQIEDPHSGVNLAGANAIKNVSTENGGPKITIALGYPAKSWIPELEQQIKDQSVQARFDIVVLPEDEFQPDAARKLIAELLQHCIFPLSVLHTPLTLLAHRLMLGLV